jgi:hypothetical protein
MSTTTAPSTNGTRPRIDQERAARRRRDDLSMGRHDPLALEGTLDNEYAYRFVNDEPGRLHRFTVTDDWDVVTTADMGSTAKDKGVGTNVERVVDRRSGQRAILLRKRREYYEADKAKEQGRIDDIEKQLKNGGSPGAQSLQAQEGSAAYVPQGGIRIDSGSGYKP